MPHPTEFVPDGIKGYFRLLARKLRYRSCFIGSPFIGCRVRLGRGCSIARHAELANDVRLGDYSYVNCGAIVASGEVGSFSSIGPYALIGMPDHPTDYLSTSPMLYGARNILGARCGWDDFPSPPVIGSDVWIGAHAFVRQGVRIGHGAVVGAGAIVTHDVPAYGIVAGVPARLLRYRFPPAEIEKLLRSPWWELPMEELRSRANRFQVPWPAAPGSLRGAESAGEFREEALSR